MGNVFKQLLNIKLCTLYFFLMCVPLNILILEHLHSAEAVQTSRNHCLGKQQPKKDFILKGAIYKTRYYNNIKLILATMKDLYEMTHFLCNFRDTSKTVSTYHISDVKNLPVHGLFVVAWRWGEPQLLECLIHKFLGVKNKQAWSKHFQNK